jgi:hypothetical protein
MMGCTLFAYLCDNVGIKLYLRQLNRVDAVYTVQSQIELYANVVGQVSKYDTRKNVNRSLEM